MILTGTIVFSSGKDGNFDIWTLELGSGKLRQLTDGSYWNDSPRWSPDGLRIVYVSNATGTPELWMMDSYGDNKTRLTSSGALHYEPSWSPDGLKIVFAGNEQDKDDVDIYTVDPVPGAEPELLISCPGWDAGPCWSPDGRSIIFSSSRSGHEDIWEYVIHSEEWKQLTTHGARDFSPALSPNGKKIAFVSERDERKPDHSSSSDSDVWIMNRDGSEMRRLTKNSGSDRFVAWSPNGNYVICCSSKVHQKAERLCVLDVKAGETVDFSYDRSKLEERIDARVLHHPLLPEVLTRFAYPESYFGTERYPHWKP